jgi:ATP-binding cassette subfamily B (MDR/TAP) protein 1
MQVSFAYPFQPDRPVLKSANICFPAGKTTFVVGRSGAGKSTLSNLLLQFYFPTSGGILIDNIPIQAIDTLWIRNNITLVQQNSFLFNETLSENIALGGRNDGSDIKEKIEICVEAANLQDTINRLPNGLQTVVGAGGNLLSGGQKQRAAIARARMKDSPILILDESTSALDFKNRMTVMNAIRKWRQGKTTIFITHDTTNILSDDLTYVLEAGQVVDSGYKCELMERNETIFSGSDDTIPEVDRSDTLSIHSTSDMPSMPHRLSYDPWFPSFGNVTLTSPTESEFLLPSRDDRHDQVHLTSPTESTVDSPTTRKPPFARHRSIPYSQVDIDTGTSEEKNFVSFRNEVLKRLRSWKSNVRTSRLKGRQLPESIDRHQILPLHRTLLTIPTILNVKQRILLVTALVCACVHAASSPIFSYLLSQLFQTFYVGGDRQAVARKWSLAVLGLALGDGAVTFAMHYLLEYCSQVWIDELRQKALKRTLDQPRSWFEEEQNEPLQLAVSLDQNAEEIRNLVGRFASLLMIAVTTAIIAISWSLVLCWKLTLVSLACAPVLYGISKGLETVSRRWESRTNDLNEMVGAIFSDTFTDIRTVRAFTLEHRFRLKHAIVLRKALIIGLKRGGYTGIFYGLAQSAIIFASGE